MSVYENEKHGSFDFPVGVHETKLANGFNLFMHIHREFELLVITKGDGVIYVDGQEYILNEGDGVFVNSHEIHGSAKAGEGPSEFFAIVFSPEIFGSRADDRVMRRFILPVMDKKIKLPVVYRRDILWQNEVLRMADEIHSLEREKSKGFELLIKAKLFSIWQMCFMYGEKNSDDSVNGIEEIKTIIEYIRAEYSSPLTLDDMAEKTNMSRGHFCRRFSEIMHMTPFEYLLQIKIDNACRILREERLSVGEVAERCGFNSFSYFSMRFKEIIGCSPTKYVKQYVKE